jgi:hypothetical protein
VRAAGEGPRYFVDAGVIGRHAQKGHRIGKRHLQGITRMLRMTKTCARVSLLQPAFGDEKVCFLALFFGTNLQAAST